jgi:hypothetical protein
VAHQWTHLNTCASQLNLSRTKLLNNITYSPWSLMATSTFRFKKACTACPKHESLPTNSLRVDSPYMAIIKQKFTPGLWRHVTRPIQFTLVVDDFGVQYVGAEHAHHIIAALETDYTVSKYWTGGLYCGITLKWDYANKHVDLSMPGYIKDALHKFQHTFPKRPQ